ncbi:hypothetical protein [Streptomyces sp. V4I2]|uniref:hypothetical protein n=1 Tax=Streptomyces sp. V4I2 TaxID=3042280 RepID=UPI0027899080|nr:hypothetical protein [Streptomyces sp. V4I2]MDQ1051087.1 hypothetical protein [Streptomyces sp. V4I2]
MSFLIVRWYLSAHHRDNPGDGCPNAALLYEIGRSADATRQACTDGRWLSSTASPPAWHPAIRRRRV